MQTQSSFPHRLGALAVVVLLLLSLHGVNSAVHNDDHGQDKDHDHSDASSDNQPKKEKLLVDDHHDHDDAHKPADGLPSASSAVLALGKAASKGAVSFHAFNGDIPPPAQALILKELERLYPEEVHAEDEALLGKLSEKTKQHLKTLLKNYNTAAKLRTYYNNEVAKINGFVDAAAKRWKKKASKLGLTRRQRAAMRAYLACSLRHLRRVIVRLAQDMDSIGCLKVFALWARSRDKKKYGNADGPTFLWLVAKEEAHFKKCHGVGPSPSNDDEYITIYHNIRESALRTNSKINAAFDKKKKPATAAAAEDKKPVDGKKPSDKKKGKEEKKSVEEEEDFNSLKCSREQLVSLRELDKEEESQVSEDEVCALHHNHKSNNNNNNNNKKVEDHKEKPPAEQTPPLKASGSNKNDKKGRKGGKSHKF